ncbi:hypothetical protein TevJSym_cb00010 [endosymbiont of Tevnia jerichonana (vent Tica)]|uniref:Uncharacterized protein n=1 Tax=endosymbiont of Tevnia jerichonana (vent Tica) TaxID=1049564 RepID=G2FJV5_9GAMM|nr:hypothetical protein TevJSym_cb00010 [endosymbiont of Tevnia jerichonana (vent Tica)]
MDRPLESRQGGAPRIVARLRWGIEDVPQDAGLLEILPELHQPQDRPADTPGEHVEGNQLAHAELVLHHQSGTNPEDQHGGDLVDQASALTSDIAQVGRPEAGADIGGKLLLPAALHLRLYRHRLERLNTAHRLHQKGLVLCTPGELLVEPAAQYWGDKERQQQIERDRPQHHPDQGRAVAVHHHKEDQGEKEVDHHRQARSGNEVTDRLQLPYPGHRIPHPTGLEIAQRQTQQVVKEAGVEAHVDAVGCMRKEAGAQTTQHYLEDRHRQQADGEHIQGGHAPMHQHLVDHHLKKERRDQGEKLQEEGGQQHLAQQPAVFNDGGDEPAEIKAAALARQQRAFSDENQLTAPGGLEDLSGQGQRAALQWILDQQPLRLSLIAGDDEIVAVVVTGDGGQCGLGQPLPITLDRP